MDRTTQSSLCLTEAFLAGKSRLHRSMCSYNMEQHATSLICGFYICQPCFCCTSMDAVVYVAEIDHLSDEGVGQVTSYIVCQAEMKEIHSFGCTH